MKKIFYYAPECEMHAMEEETVLCDSQNVVGPEFSDETEFVW